MSITLLHQTSTHDFQLFKAMISRHGIEAQLNMVEEEVSELIEALMLERHMGMTWSDYSLEEIADVVVTMQQVEVYLRVMPEDMCLANWQGVEYLAGQGYSNLPILDEYTAKAIYPSDMLIIWGSRLIKALSKRKRYHHMGEFPIREITDMVMCLDSLADRFKTIPHGKGGTYWTQVRKFWEKKVDRVEQKFDEEVCAC